MGSNGNKKTVWWQPLLCSDKSFSPVCSSLVLLCPLQEAYVGLPSQLPFNVWLIPDTTICKEAFQCMIERSHYLLNLSVYIWVSGNRKSTGHLSTINLGAKGILQNPQD
jgi:hypothetical protein